MIRRSSVFMLCLLLVPSAGLGQAPATIETSDQAARRASTTINRPKIGLVLSGGGARGLAHMGVLEWFEEHRIPVDYLAGTSMGGLVGAMYATGMSPAEMRDFVNRIDWDVVLSGPPAYRDLSYRRKEDQRAYPSGFELGVRKGLTLPQGINPGHNIGLIFDRLALPYSSIKGFDDLPIPFRCVATDMLEAKSVVLENGSLALALRATMAIPGVFTPVEFENKVLADGGLLNNIPVDVIKEMGADVSIAINVGTPLGTREDISSLIGMLTQVIGVTTIESDRRNLKQANHVITPDLGKYTSADFRATDAIADLGYQSAVKQGAGVEVYSLNEADWEAHLAVRQARRRAASYTPTALEVTGATKPGNSESISRTLRRHVGVQLETDDIEPRLSEIRGGGRYESLGYDVAQSDDQTRLRIGVTEKTYGPPILIPIIQFQSSDISDVELSLGARLTGYDVGGYGSELRLDGLVGSNDLLAIEYFRPIGRTGLFISPRAYCAASSANLFSEGVRVAEYRQRKVAAGLDAGYIFNRRSQLRIGYEVADAQAKVSIGDPVLPNLKGLVSDASTRFVYDSLNSAMVPTSGVRVSAEGHWFFQAPGAARAFPLAELRVAAFQPLTNKSSIFVYGGGGTAFSRIAGPLEQFTLGGPFRLGAYGRGEFRGSNYVLASGGFMHRLGYLPELLGGKIYAVGWYEFGSAFNHSAETNYLHSVSGAAIMETTLGPFKIGGAFGEGGRGRIFVSWGRSF